jgi:poly(ADP-ribose) glycohydrolase
MPQGSVSFERKVLPKKEQEKEVHDGAFWRSSQASLCPITLLEKGFIEDDGRDCLQVDFANRLLGGGALADGCVQVSFPLFPPFS